MSPSTPFPASLMPADRALSPRAARKPRKPLSDQEKAERRTRLEYARRRKREQAAAAKAGGMERPAALGKGESVIEYILNEDDRSAYHALLRERGTTVKTAFDWLAGRGKPVGMEAVRRHFRRFRDREAEQRHAVETAFLIAETARSRGAACVAEAAAALAEQKLVAALMSDDADCVDQQGFDLKQWQGVYRVIGGMTRARTAIEKIRQNEQKSGTEEHADSQTGQKPIGGEQRASRQEVLQTPRQPRRDSVAFSSEDMPKSDPGLDWQAHPGSPPMETWPLEWQREFLASLGVQVDAAAVRKEPAVQANGRVGEERGPMAGRPGGDGVFRQ